MRRSLYSHIEQYEVGTLAVDGLAVYIWYSPPRPLLAVPNITVYQSTASVPITVLLYNLPLLCGFNVPIKGLKLLQMMILMTTMMMMMMMFCVVCGSESEEPISVATDDTEQSLVIKRYCTKLREKNKVAILLNLCCMRAQANSAS